MTIVLKKSQDNLQGLPMFLAIQNMNYRKKSKKQDTEVMVRKSAEKQESEGESPVGEDPEDKERKATAAMEAERIKIELDKENERTGNCNVM